MRNPGARGAKVTSTKHDVPAGTAPVQVLPVPNVKSRPDAPCVTTFGFALKVVAAGTL
jgi:hypothetical protein